MKIRTTFYIRSELLELLESASLSLGMSKSALISALLKHLTDRDYGIAVWSRVRYQRKQPGADWRRVHAALCGDEYEFFLDLRKVRKFSVSFLIAFAIENYLDELVSSMRGKEDNYRYHNYAMSQIIINDIVCWLFCWGIPPEITNYR